jgi:hypothetical protein
LKARDGKELESLVRSQEGRSAADVPRSLYANSANPEGFFVEAFLPHALDLRCMVSLTPGSREAAFLGCFARVAEMEDRVVKTVIGGATAVGIEAPATVRELTARCARAVAEHAATAYGDAGADALAEPRLLSRGAGGGLGTPLLLGVDIIARCEDPGLRKGVYHAAQALSDLRRVAVEKAASLNEMMAELLALHGRELAAILEEPGFREVLSAVDGAYGRMAESRQYRGLQSLVLDYLRRAELFVGEVNARMDFGTHCRALSAPEVADRVAEAAESACFYSPNSRNSN